MLAWRGIFRLQNAIPSQYLGVTTVGESVYLYLPWSSSLSSSAAPLTRGSDIPTQESPKTSPSYPTSGIFLERGQQIPRPLSSTRRTSDIAATLPLLH